MKRLLTGILGTIAFASPSLSAEIDLGQLLAMAGGNGGNGGNGGSDCSYILGATCKAKNGGRAELLLREIPDVHRAFAVYDEDRTTPIGVMGFSFSVVESSRLVVDHVLDTDRKLVDEITRHLVQACDPEADMAVAQARQTLSLKESSLGILNGMQGGDQKVDAEFAGMVLAANEDALNARKELREAIGARWRNYFTKVNELTSEDPTVAKLQFTLASRARVGSAEGKRSKGSQMTEGRYDAWIGQLLQVDVKFWEPTAWAEKVAESAIASSSESDETPTKTVLTEMNSLSRWFAKSEKDGRTLNPVMRAVTNYRKTLEGIAGSAQAYDDDDVNHSPLYQ